MNRRHPASDTDVPSDDHSRRGVLTRRRFAQAVGTGALLTATGVSTMSATAQQDPTSFVETDGTDFVVDGDPIYFHGANNFWITDAYRGTEDRIDSLFELFEEMGINFLRTFVTCEGGDGDCYIPEPYEHAEGAFETLDYIIARAADHGIRLTLILADNWDHNGGIPQYVEWIDSADHHGDFFVNEDAKSLYKWHVEEVLTRENTITGREYREEPSIAMWELCNEPRIEGDAFGEDQDPGYEERAGILEDWIREMSEFITDIDSNHLVSTGMEGFYTRDDRTEWFYDEWTGQDFIRHHSIDTIDACSFHMYPYHWDFPLEYGPTWVREHVRDAHEEVGKPGYCGEFNVNIETGDGLETRNRFLAEWYEALDAYNANAAMIWQIVLEEMHDHDGFQIYRSESGDVLAEYAYATDVKSAGVETALQSPPSVVVNTDATAVTVDWSRVSAASEYAVSLDGSLERTTTATSATIDGLDEDVEYEVGVAAIGPDGEETTAETVTARTVGPSTVEYPEWVYGEVYQEGDRVVWNDVVWEAQWYTDDEEPRFESGYAWEFVRVLGGGVVDSDSEPTGPTPPTGLAALERTETSLEIGWDAVSEADAYGVSLEGNLVEETAATAVTIADLEPDTTYEIGVASIVDGEESTPVTITASTLSDASDSGEDEGPPAIDGSEPADTTGDGLYNDVDGSGSTTTTDVTVFFENVENAAVADYPEYYDFDGNGQVSITDVIELFESL